MAIVGLAIALLSRDATAATVVLRGTTEAVDRAKLESLIELELGGANDVDEIAVEVSGTKAAVTLKRRGGETRKGVVDLPLGGRGAVERTIALFVGEVSREREAPRASVEAPAPSVPAAEPAGTEPAPAVGQSIFAEAYARVFTTGGAFFVGPLVGADLVGHRQVRIGASARYGATSTEVPLGSVKMQFISGGPAVSYLLLADGIVELTGGVAIDVGYVWGRGDGVNGRSASTFAIAPAGFVEARWSLARRASVVTAIEGGVLAPGLDLHAGDRTALAASGLFAGARLGLALAY